MGTSPGPDSGEAYGVVAALGCCAFIEVPGGKDVPWLEEPQVLVGRQGPTGLGIAT